MSWIFVLPDDLNGIGRLIYITRLEYFPARSGPWGKGPLPVGRYQLGKPVRIDDDPRNEPFTDTLDQAWWCPITPQFTTDRKSLGIHPDGNVPGTRGCIGITLPNTLPVFALLVEGDELIVI